jgi:hypothetical protein
MTAAVSASTGSGIILSARANPEGNNDQVVQVSEDRHEVGDEVDRAQRVRDDAASEHFAYHGVRGSRQARQTT